MPAEAFQSPASRRSTEFLQTLSSSLQEISERVSPAVVQVFTRGFDFQRDSAEAGSRFGAPQQGTGSGVILDSEGHIITNAHVVEGADRIQVRLPVKAGADWRSILKPRGKTANARIVGIDRETDLAVLKIEESGLAALELGDSDRLRQGQIVLAFGSPLGLENSVSIGVVSSVARQLRPDDPMVYIQTDAPINPGNSGGPLIDSSGKVVGINTLILSQSGGSEGLGFAAPSNIVRAVFEQIRKNGRVRRGHIGAQAQTVTPALASGLKLPRDYGVLLSDVHPGGPAEAAGLRPGDLVATLDGKEMENARQFEVNLYQRQLGDLVSLEIMRGDQRIAKQVHVVERADDPDRFADLVTREAHLVEKLGILGLEVTPQIASILPPLRKPAGVVVAARVAHGYDEEGSLLPGDLISSLNGAPVLNLASLRTILAGLQPGAAVVVQVQRQGRLLYVAFHVK